MIYKQKWRVWMRRTLIMIILMMAAIHLLAGCAGAWQLMDGEGMYRTYTQISQETAMQMMKEDDGHIIIDVRRQDEYDAGHIPGAILIPNETIVRERPEQLPDLDQIILIYCRSGNRSKQAAQKLLDMGYTHIYEFGGILTWPGEIVTEESTENQTEASAPAGVNHSDSAETAKVISEFHLFRGGDMASALYDIILDEDSSLNTDAYYISVWREERHRLSNETVRKLYSVYDEYDLSRWDGFRASLEDVDDGEGFLLEIYFTDGTSVCAQGDNVFPDDYFEVMEKLQEILDHAEIIPEENDDAFADAMQPVPSLVIKVNDHVFYPSLEENSSAEALVENLSHGSIEVELHDYGNFEKVGALPWTLPRNDETITTRPGDVILYQGNQITIYYDENTWDFTRLASIGDMTREKLLEILGNGNVTASLWIEWSE